MSSLKKRYYLNEVLRTQRGNSRGIPVNAKPLFVLALIDCIEESILKNNAITFPNKEIEAVYYNLCQSYEPKRKASPYILPYFHLVGESYFDIKWKGEKFIPNAHAHSPSAKFLRDNVEFAYLDQTLWDLLQDHNVREEFRTQIVNFFLRPNNN